VRTFTDALNIGCLVGGINPAADPTGFFSEGHYRHLSASYPDLVRMIAGKRNIFVDSITDLTRQAMAWAKTRPEAFSDKTGKPDTRGAYGLLAREVIGLLKHLQHAPARTVIFVGILERVTDEFNRVTWQPQMEGGKAARELPGIVDQVISMTSPPKVTAGGMSPNVAMPVASSAAPVINLAFPPRIAADASTSPSRRISARSSQKSTQPRKDEDHELRHERCRAAEDRRAHCGRQLCQGDHDHPPRRNRWPGRDRPMPAQSPKRSH
jgi:hypothetical protein